MLHSFPHVAVILLKGWGRGEQNWHSNFLTVCLRGSSSCYFHAVCSQIVCMPSLPGWHNALWDVSLPSPLTFKIASFQPFWLQELTKVSPIHFPNLMVTRKCSPCTILCVPLSHTLLHHDFLPSTAARIHFSCKPHLCTFYLL